MTGWLIPLVIVAAFAIALLFAPIRKILRKALNLAVARLDDDTMKRVNGLAAAPEPTDWAALAGQIDRFGLGKHREERPWM